MFFLLPLTALAQAPLHHELVVRLSPDKGFIDAQDTLHLPANASRSLVFALHPGMELKALTPGAKITNKAIKQGLALYSIDLPKESATLKLAYHGTIQQAPEQEKEEARQFQTTTGTIAPEGVFLSGASHWYPQFDSNDNITFSLTIELPFGWDAVSQGERPRHEKAAHRTTVTWESKQPQDEIYLIASRFTEYASPAGETTAQVFLRTPDEAMAKRYLEATGKYLAMYEALLGRYPYKKFALVENFWETGYGMPSFTLLGSQVIRFPFIINSSYPHEILHNWWGNGVYVDYQSGNWSEGLTSYLADHLLQEQQGKGADYRRSALQKYTDFAAASRDFPLSEFRSRFSSASEAVGYGKTLMLMHMLRLQLGDELFRQALRQFYNDNLFRRTSFTDMAQAFSSVTKQDMQPLFDQWVKQAGAPELRLSEVKTKSAAGGYLLTARLQQVQGGRPYQLRVPLALTLEGQETAYQTSVEINAASQDIELTLPARPLRMDIDPEFDVFRRLDQNEIPPALSLIFGAEAALIVLPANASSDALTAYRKAAENWQQNPNIRIDIRLDSEIGSLPGDRAVWLFGWENKFLPSLSPTLEQVGATLGQLKLRIDEQHFARQDGSFAFATRNPANPELALSWFASDNPAAIPGLARKLPHYSQASYAVFTGNEPRNIAKGMWTLSKSPLSAPVVQEDASQREVPRGKLAIRQALTN